MRHTRGQLIYIAAIMNVRENLETERLEKRSKTPHRSRPTVHRPPKPFKEMTGDEYMRYLDQTGAL